MNHLILAETQFFALINGKDNGSTETAYGGFVQEVINLCYGGNDAKHIIVALAFAEIELQHHPQNLSASEENVVTVYIRKALSFIRKMQKIVSASAITSVPPLTSTSETKATVPALQWTGNAVELVELIYGVSRFLVGINFRHPNVMPNFAVWKTITYRHWHRWCCQPRF